MQKNTKYVLLIISLIILIAGVALYYKSVKTKSDLSPEAQRIILNDLEKNKPAYKYSEEEIAEMNKNLEELKAKAQAESASTTEEERIKMMEQTEALVR